MSDHDVHVACFQLTEDSALERLPAETPSAAWLHDEVKRWLDIETRELLALQGVLAPFDLPPDILHACMNRPSVTRVEAHDHLVSVQMPLPAAAPRLPGAGLALVCLPTLLVTIHPQPFPRLATLTATLTRARHLYAPTLPALLVLLLYHCIEEDFRAYLALREAVDQLSEVFETTPADVEGKTILDLKRQVGHLAATCEDQLFVTLALETIDSPVFSVRHLRKAYDSVAQGVRYCQGGVARLEAQVQDLHQHYVLMVQEATNHRLRILTIMSVVCMPLTLIAGIYGMNFQHMPELTSPIAYPLVLGAMLAIALLLVGMFYRKGWFT